MGLKFVFWDVQHGNATYVSTPGGQHFVIDLGVGSIKPALATFSPLLHLKREWNVEQLDGVIITHPHRDHLDDIGNLDELSPRVFTRPKHLTEEDIRRGNTSSDRAILDMYFDVDRRYSHPVAAGASPYDAGNNGGVDIRKFTPTRCSTSQLNDHSIVTVFQYAGLKTVIPGDNEAPSWRELLEREDFRAAIAGTDVLLASHHGRQAGFCRDLFDHISPRITVISDGPVTDTSATASYAQHTRGWTVHRRTGDDETRKVVTTRCDGVVVVECGRSAQGKSFLSVIID